MKIKFRYDCIDKYNGEFYFKDSERDFEDARALEIIKVGFAYEVEEAKEEPIKLSDMTKKELVALAKENGVSHTGTKEELIKRLLELA